LRAKINMGYVWDGCVGMECESVCAQRWPIANWSSRFVTKFSFAIAERYHPTDKHSEADA